MTEILGGPDIYVDRGSTLNVTCVVWAESKAPDYIFWSHNDRVNILIRNNFMLFEFRVLFPNVMYVFVLFAMVFVCFIAATEMIRNVSRIV